MGIRSRRKPLPTEPVRATVESLTHDGRGIVRIDGKPVFVEGALPGEEISFVYTEVRRDFGEGRAVEIHTPAPGRVEPRCPSFGICGGCSFQHVADQEQIRFKQDALIEQFRRTARLVDWPLFPPLTGPNWGYRHKARLGVKYVAKKGRVLVGFRERSSPFIADLQACPVLHPRVGERLLDLAEMIGRLSIRDRVPQIEVAVGDDRAALVFRILADLTEADRQCLADFARDFDLDVYIQRHGPDTVAPLYPSDPSLLSYALPEQGVHFTFQPTDFTQVNIDINRGMVSRVMELMDPQADERILDLFCGIGNFTLPLATRAGHVVGVEGSAEAVARARQNAADNGLGNVECHVADLTQPLDGHPWAEGPYDKVLLDPSRAGAEAVLAGIPRWQPGRIVYVSCNPSTLARDAAILVHQHGYRLLRAGVMDMFPQTAHVESIALFER